MISKLMREAVLKRDNYECQHCKDYGIPKLVEQAENGTKWIPDDRLEVHHKRYPARGIGDLILVCKRCHDDITGYVRGYRYAAQAHIVEPISIVRPKLIETRARRFIDGNDQISVDRHRPDFDAQRSARRSTEREGEGDQSNIK